MCIYIRTGSPGACLLAWALSGMLVCLTSQCYFELGSMMPTAGERGWGEVFFNDDVLYSEFLSI